MKLHITPILLVLSQLAVYSQQYALQEEFYWGQAEFEFPSVSVRKYALLTGSYIPENNNIYAIAVWRDVVFVSIFRLKAGVVSSFNCFRLHDGNKSPLLTPYPSFQANYINEDRHHRTVDLPRSSSIINAAYFRIDYKCNRLWVADAGVTDFFGERRVITRPAIVIFDLETNTLIRRYKIPREFITSESLFLNLEIDIKGGNCDDGYAYMSDLFRSIVVYSFRKDRSWRLTHNHFGSDPLAGNFFYEGINFQWNYGVLGLTLGEHNKDGSKRVYIKPFASTKTFYISNYVLQDERYILSNNCFYDVHLLGDRGKNGHIYQYAYDKETNVLFDAQFNRKRIGCWNTANRYRNSSFEVVYREKKSFFPINVSIDKNRNLWVVTNNYPKFAYGPWNPNAKNARVYRGQIDDLISGTVCEK